MELRTSIFLNALTKKVISDSDRSFYICPITKQIMVDPVLASDNYTYEYYAIQNLLNTTGKSPKTGQSLTNVLQSNITMKEQIDAFKLGSVYFVQPPEYDGTTTYKIGRSKEKDFKRINQYTKKKKKAEPIAHNQCNYYWLVEKALKETFKRKFTLVKGTEYFAGDKAEMMMVFSSVVAKYSKKHYDLEHNVQDIVGAWKLGQGQPAQSTLSQFFVASQGLLAADTTESVSVETSVDVNIASNSTSHTIPDATPASVVQWYNESSLTWDDHSMIKIIELYSKNTESYKKWCKQHGIKNCNRKKMIDILCTQKGHRLHVAGNGHTYLKNLKYTSQPSVDNTTQLSGNKRKKKGQKQVPKKPTPRETELHEGFYAKHVQPALHVPSSKNQTTPQGRANAKEVYTKFVEYCISQNFCTESNSRRKVIRNKFVKFMEEQGHEYKLIGSGNLRFLNMNLVD